jgi:hypothetical protein
MWERVQGGQNDALQTRGRNGYPSEETKKRLLYDQSWIPDDVVKMK